jgi:hypothetical protein
MKTKLKIVKPDKINDITLSISIISIPIEVKNCKKVISIAIKLIKITCSPGKKIIKNDKNVAFFKFSIFFILIWIFIC